MEDNLFYFGDAVKALDDTGRVGGLLVRFSTSKRKDLDGQYFDKEGYYGPQRGDGAECLFDHGYAVPADRYVKDIKREHVQALQAFADRTFTPIKTTLTPLGIFAETVLNLEDEYEKFIHSRVKAGKIGWSSGASGHRVKIEKDGRITRWPIAEGSLTPRPAEPLNRVLTMKSLAAVKFIDLLDEDDEVTTDEGDKVTPIKSSGLSSVLTRHIEDRTDEGHDRETIIKSLAREAGLDTEQIESILDGSSLASIPNLKAFARVLEVSFDALKSAKQRDYSRTIKGMFEEVLADRTPSRWELDSVYSDIIRKLANTAQASAVTDVEFDLAGKVKEATEEYATRLQSLAVAQINEYVESGSDEPFYLKAIIDLSTDLPVSGHLDLESHSQLAVSALRDVIKRFRVNHENRKRETPTHKAGRVLSQANRTRLSTMLEQIQAAVSDCQKLLEESTPKASDEEKRAVISQQLRLEQRARQLGSPAI